MLFKERLPKICVSFSCVALGIAKSTAQKCLLLRLKSFLNDVEVLQNVLHIPCKMFNKSILTLLNQIRLNRVKTGFIR